jgi:hypothetical protein
MGPIFVDPNVVEVQGKVMRVLRQMQWAWTHCHESSRDRESYWLPIPTLFLGLFMSRGQLSGALG